MKLKVSCIQINCKNNLHKNLNKLCKLILAALEDKPDLIALPENCIFMATNNDERAKNSYYPEDHPALKELQNLALNKKIWILVGSLSIKLKGTFKTANRCFLIDNKGKINSHYDKIHLYDVQVKDGENHKESKTAKAGTKLVNAKTPWGKIGLSICYDLRFPNMYRILAQNGAKIITIPAAFTKFTGKMHWHSLLKARAIETGSFIIAPAQTGKHPNERQTYGHSMIIDPWGNILAEASIKEGHITAQINLKEADAARQQIPAINTETEYSF